MSAYQKLEELQVEKGVIESQLLQNKQKVKEEHEEAL